MSDEAPGHEGYLVGLVEEGDPLILHELKYPDDARRERVQLLLFQVGCDCGWRSPVFHAPSRAYWMPFMAELADDELENEAWSVWRQHWRFPAKLGARSRVAMPSKTTTRLNPRGGPAGACLELMKEQGGPRAFLDGKPVHAGAMLELKLADGTWKLGRYEYRISDHDPLHLMFFIGVECATPPPSWAADPEPGSVYTEACLTIPPSAMFRWPR